MAELKTIVLKFTELDLVAGASVRFSDELIAEEDMKIIGCAMHYTNNLGQDSKIAVSRSGVYCEPGSYNPIEEMDTERGILFADRFSNPGNTTFAEKLSTWQMLPDGHYFMLEKGERIYAHVEHHNKHTSSGYSYTCDVVLYYY